MWRCEHTVRREVKVANAADLDYVAISFMRSLRTKGSPPVNRTLVIPKVATIEMRRVFPRTSADLSLACSGYPPQACNKNIEGYNGP